MDMFALAGLGAANLAASLIPGPNAALVATASIQRGPASGLASLSGIIAAEAAWAAVALLALAGLIDLASIDLALIQQVGGGAVAAFGLAACIGSMTVAQPSHEIQLPGMRAGVGAIAAGLTVGLANPVAAVFFLAIIPQFLPVGLSGPSDVLACLGIIVASSALGHAPYLAGGWAAAAIGAVVKRQAALTVGFVMLLFGLAAMMGVDIV